MFARVYFLRNFTKNYLLFDKNVYNIIIRSVMTFTFSLM